METMTNNPQLKDVAASVPGDTWLEGSLPFKGRPDAKVGDYALGLATQLGLQCRVVIERKGWFSERDTIYLAGRLADLRQFESTLEATLAHYNQNRADRAAVRMAS